MTDKQMVPADRGNIEAVIPNEVAGSPATIRDTLSRKAVQEAIEYALPAHITPKQFSKIILRAVNGSPKLLQCDQLSIVSAAIESAALGLDCSGKEEESNE